MNRIVLLSGAAAMFILASIEQAGGPVSCPPGVAAALTLMWIGLAVKK